MTITVICLPSCQGWQRTRCASTTWRDFTKMMQILMRGKPWFWWAEIQIVERWKRTFGVRSHQNRYKKGVFYHGVADAHVQFENWDMAQEHWKKHQSVAVLHAWGSASCKQQPLDAREVLCGWTDADAKILWWLHFYCLLGKGPPFRHWSHSQARSSQKTSLVYDICLSN